MESRVTLTKRDLVHIVDHITWMQVLALQAVTSQLIAMDHVTVVATFWGGLVIQVVIQVVIGQLAAITAAVSANFKIRHVVVARPESTM